MNSDKLISKTHFADYLCAHFPTYCNHPTIDGAFDIMNNSLDNETDSDSLSFNDLAHFYKQTLNKDLTEAEYLSIHNTMTGGGLDTETDSERCNLFLKKHMSEHEFNNLSELDISFAFFDLNNFSGNVEDLSDLHNVPDFMDFTCKSEEDSEKLRHCIIKKLFENNPNAGNFLKINLKKFGIENVDSDEAKEILKKSSILNGTSTTFTVRPDTIIDTQSLIHLEPINLHMADPSIKIKHNGCIYQAVEQKVDNGGVFYNFFKDDKFFMSIAKYNEFTHDNRTWCCHGREVSVRQEVSDINDVKRMR